ncbi:HNH endonuclease, partial [Mesorhizobium sp. BR1-1-7]|nr:HNH endonuclease [Mesorhizobium sp. BR1-1-7]
ALGGEPVLANAQVLCAPCHKEKTADRIAKIRKADRQRDKASGAIRSKQTLRGPAFPKSSKPPRESKQQLAPKLIYASRTTT